MDDILHIDWRAVGTALGVVTTVIGLVYAWAARRFVQVERYARDQDKINTRLTEVEGKCSAIMERISQMPSATEIAELRGDMGVLNANLTHLQEWIRRNDSYIRGLSNKK